MGGLPISPDQPEPDCSQEKTQYACGLDRITQFAVNGWLGDFYRVRANDRMTEIPKNGIYIETIEDVKEFKNLVDLELELQDEDIRDLSAMGSMTGLTRLSLIVSPELDNLEFLRPLTKLKSIMVILPSVTDRAVPAELPNLKQLYINCNSEVDAKSPVQAKQIESLMVNTKPIR